MEKRKETVSRQLNTHKGALDHVEKQIEMKKNKLQEITNQIKDAQGKKKGILKDIGVQKVMKESKKNQ